MRNNMPYFTEDTIKFFTQLEKNNTKEWFEAHREDLELHIMEPARVFVMHMGDKLREIAPDVQAIPKTDKSIFRLHRDTRFSKNKAPYKTNLGILFWEGPGKKLDCPGFYMHIEPKSFFIALGFYMFTPEHLKKYREAVYNPSNAEDLTKVLKTLKRKGYSVNEPHFKQVPRGFDKEYKYADLLKYNGLYAYYENNDLNELLEADQIKFIFKKFKDMLPIHHWLLDNLF